MANKPPSGSIRIDPALHSKLKEWCDKNGLKIRWAAEQGIKRLMDVAGRRT